MRLFTHMHTWKIEKYSNQSFEWRDLNYVIIVPILIFPCFLSNGNCQNGRVGVAWDFHIKSYFFLILFSYNITWLNIVHWVIWTEHMQFRMQCENIAVPKLFSSHRAGVCASFSPTNNCLFSISLLKWFYSYIFSPLHLP